MSRNLCETHCARCGFRVKLVEKPRPITVEDCGEHWYNEGQRGMIVANAECVLCGAKYLAWVDDRKAEKVGKDFGEACFGRNIGRAQASDFELAEAAEDGTDYFFDLSYRSSFNDEPGDDDLPPFDVDHPFAAKDAEIERLKQTNTFGLLVLVCSLFDAMDSGKDKVGHAIMRRLRDKVAGFREIVRGDVDAYGKAKDGGA